MWQNNLKLHLNVTFGMCSIGLLNCRNSSQPHAKLHLRVLRSSQISLVSWNVFCSKSLFSLLVCQAQYTTDIVLKSMPRRDGTHRSFIISNSLWVLQECFNPQRTNPPSVTHWHHLRLRSKWHNVDFKC